MDPAVVPLGVVDRIEFPKPPAMPLLVATIVVGQLERINKLQNLVNKIHPLVFVETWIEHYENVVTFPSCLVEIVYSQFST